MGSHAKGIFIENAVEKIKDKIPDFSKNEALNIMDDIVKNATINDNALDVEFENTEWENPVWQLAAKAFGVTKNDLDNYIVSQSKIVDWEVLIQDAVFDLIKKPFSKRYGFY